MTGQEPSDETSDETSHETSHETNNRPDDTPAQAGNTQSQSSAGPVAASARIETLDFIRGLAVMGILGANIVVFGHVASAYTWPGAFGVDPADPGGWMWITQFILIAGKMRGLFTLLFGAGIYLFMERTLQRGGTASLQVWRLFILMLFGLIHFYLIWFGDILFLYSLAGFAVVPCLRWSVKTQLFTGIAGYLLGGLVFGAFFTLPHSVMQTPMAEGDPAFAEMREDLVGAKVAQMADEEVYTQLVQAGDYAAVLAYRFETEMYDPIGNAFLFALESWPLMRIGVALYRVGFFSGALDHSKMRIWGWAGLIVGGALHLAIGLAVKQSGFAYYTTLAGLVGWSPVPRLMMTIGLAALLVVYSPGWTGALAVRVRAAGRVAFTNYLGTSIAMLFVFQEFGLGLFGELNRPQLYLVMALSWAVMLLWSKPWLDRYRYGPLEWLWRCLTYRELFALKR